MRPSERTAGRARRVAKRLFETTGRVRPSERTAGHRSAGEVRGPGFEPGLTAWKAVVIATRPTTLGREVPGRRLRLFRIRGTAVRLTAGRDGKPLATERPSETADDGKRTDDDGTTDSDETADDGTTRRRWDDSDETAVGGRPRGHGKRGRPENDRLVFTRVLTQTFAGRPADVPKH